MSSAPTLCVRVGSISPPFSSCGELRGSCEGVENVRVVVWGVVSPLSRSHSIAELSSPLIMYA